MPSQLEVAAAIRDAGLRVTKQRTAVLTAVNAHPHADTSEIIESARKAIPQLSHQAVYDALRALTDSGLVRCIEPAGSTARYETRTGDNHHHVICRGCGQIADVDCAVGQTPCLSPAHSHGFVIDEAEVVYWGYCPGCSAKLPSKAATKLTETDPKVSANSPTTL